MDFNSAVSSMPREMRSAGLELVGTCLHVAAAVFLYKSNSVAYEVLLIKYKLITSLIYGTTAGFYIKFCNTEIN